MYPIAPDHLNWIHTGAPQRRHGQEATGRKVAPVRNAQLCQLRFVSFSATDPRNAIQDRVDFVKQLRLRLNSEQVVPDAIRFDVSRPPTREVRPNGPDVRADKTRPQTGTALPFQSLRKSAPVREEPCQQSKNPALDSDAMSAAVVPGNDVEQ